MREKLIFTTTASINLTRSPRTYTVKGFDMAGNAVSEDIEVPDWPEGATTEQAFDLDRGLTIVTPGTLSQDCAISIGRAGG